MTRQVRRLDSKAVRSKLKVREAPYWVRCGARGCHLGYRRLRGGFGTWLAKLRDPATKRRIQEALGTADDVLPADGTNVLSWEQAEAKAREFFGRKSKSPVQGGKQTVSDALESYFKNRERRGKAKAMAGDRQYVDAHIVPKFGAVELRKLTTAHLQQWMDDLAEAPCRVRSGKGAPQQFKAAPTTDNDKRARKATCNRVWAIFKAALRHSAKGRADEWAAVQPFEGVSKARVRFFSADEIVKLVNACDPCFRDVVRAGLLTGARYSEITRFRREDFNPASKTLLVRESKSGRSRHIALTTEGAEFFTNRCRGLASNDLIFKRSDGKQWGVGRQKPYVDAAAEAANVKLGKGDGFHCLRHTYASTLVMGGVPLKAVADQLGHTTTAMVEKHYGHLAQGFVASAVERAMGNLGITGTSNVVGIRGEAA